MSASGGYYAVHLAADRLRRCYDLATPRVQQYLDAEIKHVRAKIKCDNRVLEVGCGYGRVLASIAQSTAFAVGIDNAVASIRMARKILPPPQPLLLVANVVALPFPSGSFDCVVCVQNGISAFGVEPTKLAHECLRVTRRGGCILLSSYAAKFWPHRLEWFRLQAEAGLIGEIDPDRTHDGVIVCKDGFRATTFLPADFQELANCCRAESEIVEVDGSSVFCTLRA